MKWTPIKQKWDKYLTFKYHISINKNVSNIKNNTKRKT